MRLPPPQDLRRSTLVLWVDDVDRIVNANTSWFFTAFAAHIVVRVFKFEDEVKGTPLEGDPYFGSAAAIMGSIHSERRLAVWSDLVRYILLHNYGGLWCARHSLFCCGRIWIRPHLPLCQIT